MNEISKEKCFLIAVLNELFEIKCYLSEWNQFEAGVSLGSLMASLEVRLDDLEEEEEEEEDKEQEKYVHHDEHQCQH